MINKLFAARVGLMDEDFSQYKIENIRKYYKDSYLVEKMFEYLQPFHKDLLDQIEKESQNRSIQLGEYVFFGRDPDMAKFVITQEEKEPENFKKTNSAQLLLSQLRIEADLLKKEIEAEKVNEEKIRNLKTVKVIPKTIDEDFLRKKEQKTQERSNRLQKLTENTIKKRTAMVDHVMNSVVNATKIQQEIQQKKIDKIKQKQNRYREKVQEIIQMKQKNEVEQLKVFLQPVEEIPEKEVDVKQKKSVLKEEKIAEIRKKFDEQKKEMMKTSQIKEDAANQRIQLTLSQNISAIQKRVEIMKTKQLKAQDTKNLIQEQELNKKIIRMQQKEENYQRHKTIDDKLRKPIQKDNLEQNLQVINQQEQKYEILELMDLQKRQENKQKLKNEKLEFRTQFEAEIISKREKISALRDQFENLSKQNKKEVKTQINQLLKEINELNADGLKPFLKQIEELTLLIKQIEVEMQSANKKQYEVLYKQLLEAKMQLQNCEIDSKLKHSKALRLKQDQISKLQNGFEVENQLKRATVQSQILELGKQISAIQQSGGQMKEQLLMEKRQHLKALKEQVVGSSGLLKNELTIKIQKISNEIEQME